MKTTLFGVCLLGIALAAGATGVWPDGSAMDAWFADKSPVDETKLGRQYFASRMSEAKAAHARGCLFRLWGFPGHKEAWEQTLELGLDYLNTDHPAATAAFLHGNDGDDSY